MTEVADLRTQFMETNCSIIDSVYKRNNEFELATQNIDRKVMGTEVVWNNADNIVIQM